MAINALAYDANGEIVEVAVQEAGTTGGSFGLAGVTAVTPLAATDGATPQISWYPTAPVNMNNQQLLNARLELCTSSTRPSGLGTGDKGRVLLDTDINRLIVWTGSAWATALDNGLASGKILVGDSSGLTVARTLSGDISVSNTGVVSVLGLRGVTIEAAPDTDGYVLGYDISSNTLKWVENVAAVSGGISVDITVHAPAPLDALTVVNLYPGSGYPNARPAVSAAGTDYPATGIVLNDITGGAEGTVRCYGSVTGFTGLTPGGFYYLNPAVPGGLTLTTPTGVDQKLQVVGIAVDSANLFTDIKPRVTVIATAPANSVNVLRANTQGDLLQVAVPTRITARTGPRFPKTFILGDLFYHTLLREFFTYTSVSLAPWQGATAAETMISTLLTLSGTGTLAGILSPLPSNQDKIYLETLILFARQASTLNSTNYWSFQSGTLPVGYTTPATDFTGYGSAFSVYDGIRVAGTRYSFKATVNSIVNPSSIEAWAYKAISTGTPGNLSLDYATVRYRRIGAEPTAGGYAEAVFASSPIAYWRFAEPSGSRVAYDYSGYENLARIDTAVTVGTTGFSFTGESSSTGFTFPAVTTAARVTAAVPQVPATAGSAVTVEFWMYVTAPSDTLPLPSPSYRAIFSFGGGLSLGFYGDQTDTFKFGFSTGQGDIQGTATWSGLTNTWAHVMAVCYRDAFYTNKIYVNGSLRTLTSLAIPASNTTAFNSPDTSVTIGNYNLLPGTNAGAILDEIALYPVALTSTDASTHYAAR